MNEPSAKILIVDDTPPNVDVLRNILSPEGYKISFAHSGERALKIVPHFLPDLILLDVNMPGLDGFATCERLKQNKETHDIPVIFVTARTEVDALAQAFKVGGVDFITKPIKELEVLSRVNTQISLQQSKAELKRQLVRNESIAHYNHLLLKSVADGIFSLNAHGEVVFVNPAAEALLGWKEKELTSQHFINLFDLSESEVVAWEDHDIHKRCSEGKPHEEEEVSLCRKDGTTFLACYAASPLFLDQDAYSGVVVIFRDITQEHEWTDKIQYQATHDALTGLINRREFENRLGDLARTAFEDNKTHIMLYLDLDQFKVVNDTCGHEAGDELLRQVTKAIQKDIRDSDTLARLGGDEFGVLLSGCHIEAGLRTANKILASIQDFRFCWQSKCFVIGVSIGLVEINQKQPSVSEILKLADTACYAAKEAGRNRIHMYDEGDQALKKHQGEMHWVARINKALEQNAFVIHRQSIIPVSSDKNDPIDHFEVLIRMNDDTGELVPPGAFLPAAERYNIISNVDQWVITSLFGWLNAQNKNNDKNILCSVNLSGHTLGCDHFVDFLDISFEKYNINPRNICFEITETAAIASLSRVSNFISHLRARGCKFALDDFGSGLSSYAYLKELPVDYLKIDGAFIKDICNDPIDYAMVKSINEMGHIMGKQTIAEFVENKDIFEKLREIGVDYAQGYAVDKPSAI